MMPLEVLASLWPLPSITRYMSVQKVYDPVIDDWWDTTYVETYTIEDTTYYDTIYTWTKLNYPNSNPVILNNELYFLNVRRRVLEL